MDNNYDRLQARLASLEAGGSPEAALAGLPEDEAATMRMAIALREQPALARETGIVAAQREALLHQVPENKRLETQTANPQTHQWPRFQWVGPALLAAGGLATVVVFVAGAALVWNLWQLGRRSVASPEAPSAAISVATSAATSVATSAATDVATVSAPIPVVLNPQTGVLEEVHGLVEIQGEDGLWTQAGVGQAMVASRRLRTGVLSQAALIFYDGSRARLGPETELSVDALDAQKSGPRVVRLTQWVGETDHTVAHSTDPASHYEVATPSGTGAAKGTVFQVLVTPAHLVRFNVSEGAVAVTGAEVTVIVIAGQTTAIPFGQPPAEPVFRITGEGTVEATGTTWKIAGQSFLTDANTILIGNPQINDWVAFEGHLAPDGTHLADRISLLRRAPENKFAFEGVVETMGTSAWKISGRTIQVDGQTAIQAGIVISDRVRVEGILTAGGTLLATQIDLAKPEPAGLPFGFTGVVESITSESWVVSGISLSVTAETQLEPAIAVGDLVEVKGNLAPDGKWLTKSIHQAKGPDPKFDVTGRVESLDPWQVAGVPFTVTAQTQIETGIQVGDQVKVKGLVLADGTWLAAEIRLVNTARPLPFHFVGQVTSMNPWMVGSITLTTDAHTKIREGIRLGEIVEARGKILPDDTWLAEEIKLLENKPSCFDAHGIIASINGDEVMFLDGYKLKLDKGVVVAGKLQPASVVTLHTCSPHKGEIAVISIIVIYYLPALPTPMPTPILLLTPTVNCPGLQAVVVSGGKIALPNGSRIQLADGRWAEIKLPGKKGDKAEITWTGLEPKLEVNVKDKGKQPEIEVKITGKGKELNQVALIGGGKLKFATGVTVWICSGANGPVFLVKGILLTHTPPKPPKK